ncbi:HET domain protein [Nemania abortiva]|nr:HET domain protein [Nemania abortiva]
MDGQRLNSKKRERQEGSHDGHWDPQNDSENNIIILPVTKKARKATGRASSLSPTSSPSLRYRFDPLPNGYIRLLKLLPHRDKCAPIQCHLVNHFLLDPDSGEGPHLYEALSYVWGSPEKSQIIYTETGFIDITRNLHAALLRLRDRTFPRIIWADGICINQDDSTERACQVQSMAMIYAIATRVVVWLEQPVHGEIATNGDEALEVIRVAGQSTSDRVSQADRKAVSTLLHRSWFQRVWTLQEISAARQILITTLGTEIDGFGFYLGLKALNPVLGDSSMQNLVHSVTYLLEGSTTRPKKITAGTDRFSLNISPLGQLIDIYHRRQATDRRDKVYALLGMSPHNYSISVDYDISWKDLFRHLIKSLIGPGASVDTWNEDEFALIRTKGHIIGKVLHVSTDGGSIGKQVITIRLTNSLRHFLIHCELNETAWVIQTVAKPICAGDIVCIFPGASCPAVIRGHEDYCTLLATSITPLIVAPARRQLHHLLRYTRLESGPPLSFLLFWDWEGSSGQPEKLESYDSLQYRVLHRRNIKLSNHWNRAARLHIMGMLLMELDYDLDASGLLLRAIELYEGKTRIGELLDTREVTDIHRKYHSRRFRLVANILARKSDGFSSTQNDALEIARWHNFELMKFLFDRKGKEVQITERLFEAAIANQHYALKLIKLFMEEQVDKVVITERILEKALQNQDRENLIALLRYQDVGNTAVTAEILITAIQQGKSAQYLTHTFLAMQNDKTVITERVLKKAASQGRWAKEILALLLARQDDKTVITEAVLCRAAKQGLWAKEIMTLLLSQQIAENPITEEVLRAAACNHDDHGGLMALLVNQQFDKSVITDDVLIEASRSRGNIEPLINYGGDELSISGNLLMAFDPDDEEAAEFFSSRYMEQYIRVCSMILRALARMGIEVSR